MTNKEKTIIFDIDGTLSDPTERRKYLASKIPDWERFNNTISLDNINTPIVALYQTLWISKQYDIILVTGRMEKQRSDTEKWLLKHSIPFNRMIMRKNDDFRKDSIIKEEILQTLQNEQKEILFVIDDRQQVVDMWRKNGITCLQCDYGDF